MLLSSNGIVLSSVKYGENSTISKVFSQEKGLLTLISSRSRSKKAKQANFFQPLSLLHFICYFSNNSMHRVKEVSFVKGGEGAYEDVAANSIKFFLAELLSKLIKEEEQNLELYQFLYTQIQLLNSQKTNYGDFHLRFLISFFDQLGIQPHIKPSDIYFDLQEGASTSTKPTHQDFLESKNSTLFFRACNGDLNFIKTEKNQVLNLIINYYNIQIGGGLENLKSKAVLEVVFG